MKGDRGRGSMGKESRRTAFGRPSKTFGLPGWGKKGRGQRKSCGRDPCKVKKKTGACLTRNCDRKGNDFLMSRPGGKREFKVILREVHLLENATCREWNVKMLLIGAIRRRILGRGVPGQRDTFTRLEAACIKGPAPAPNPRPKKLGRTFKGGGVCLPSRRGF